MSGKPPVFPLYAKDFRVDTEELTHEECGIYIRLLTKIWIGAKDLPQGFIPGEIPAIFKILGDDYRTNSLLLQPLSNVLGLLKLTDSEPKMYYSPRLLEELERLRALREVKVAAGNMGGRPRKHQLSEEPVSEKASGSSEKSLAIAIATALVRGAEANASSTSVGNGATPTPRPCRCGCGRSLAGRPGNTKWATPDCANQHAQRVAADAAAGHGAALQRIVAFYNKMTGRLTAAEAQGRPALQLLQLGVPEPTVKLAILGAMTDPFHLGFNDREQPYLDLVTILRRDRYEGHADRARQATFRNVKQDVLGFWATRWNKDKNSTMKRLFMARDVQLKQEGGQPFGAAAAFDGLPRGAAWPEEERPS